MRRRTRFIVLLTTLLVLAVGGLFNWQPRVNAQLPMFFGATRFPALDVDGRDNIFLAMSVATASDRPHSQIFFTQSRDGGRTWDNLPQTRNLTNSPGEAFGPSIAVTKGSTPRAYITYHDNTPGPTQSFLIRSKKKAKFKKPVNITPHNGGAFLPRVALDSGEGVNIVWGDTLQAHQRVMFVRSTDQGGTFTEAKDISRSTADAFAPEITVDPQDAINVAWEDAATGVKQIMFRRSTDGGVTFSEPKQISKGQGPATEAHIASDSAGRLGIVWVDASGGSAQAFYSQSLDHGQTFSDPVDLSNLPGGDIHKPFITTFHDTIYVSFEDQAAGDMQVFVVVSTDAGLSFGKATQVSNADNSKGRGHSAAMVVDSTGVLHIVWIDSSIVGRDEGLLFYSNSTNGHKFSPQQMILAAI
jgi:hypothetical protein